MGVSEKLRIAWLTADRSRRAALSRILYSPMLRWRLGRPTAEQLVIVPQDLRTADPSFWSEIELGQFGLAETIAELHDKSPFEITPPNPGWARALHGFDWLRNLEASRRPEARDLARKLTLEWVQRTRSGQGLPYEPAVMGRRLIAWLSHAELLLDGVDAKTYQTIMESIGTQLVRLSASWREGAEGHPRLVALIALVLADLSIAGHDSELIEAETALADELERQMLADGGHISRNPSVLVELMLDLLPLRQCFASRERKPPAPVVEVLRKIPLMLRFMRLGDGTLARFNGVSAGLSTGLATVLAYDDGAEARSGLAPQSRYARLGRGNTVIIMDAGAPPPLEYSPAAHAGCLSFEMSASGRALFVNGGAPGAAQASWHAMARSTASHNTLAIAETSSSLLVRDPRLEEMVGGPGLKGPMRVEARVLESDGALEATASHDGYRSRYGLIHRRRLVLSADGTRVEGFDTLTGPRGSVRLRQDIPFAVHFHLHPLSECRAAGENAVDIVLKDGKIWHFSARGARLSIEEGTYFADAAGPRTATQIVLRASTFGETEVAWVAEARP